ncbi:hypothetical protein DPMN_175166 [Dreissena polymorpha]|uniref:Uncharacterized protein n=1 Tax=Dreissena polymorpha TaxID=45954 RepID=A0A9D4IIH4_DREPO|nr:hypothetical protein DPMN_175166 [Dreissena polymorpha]
MDQSYTCATWMEDNCSIKCGMTVVSKIVAIHRTGSLFAREPAKAGKIHRTAI